MIEDAERKIYSKTAEIIKEAKEKNCCPCAICTQVEHPKKCAGGNCYMWYAWFCEKWQNIQEAARRKGMNVKKRG